MGFSITHRMGDMEGDPVGDWLEPLLAELDLMDDEHPDVAVAHESGWGLSAFPSGLVVWGNVERDDDEVRGMLSRAELRRAFVALARGDVAAVALMLSRRQQPSNTGDRLGEA